MIVYHPENTPASSKSHDPTVSLGEVLPSTPSQNLLTESSEAGLAALDPLAANSVQAILISQTPTHSNSKNAQSSLHHLSESFVPMFELIEPMDDNLRQPETVSRADDDHGTLAQCFTTQPANTGEDMLEATNPLPKPRPPNLGDKTTMAEESSRKLESPLMHSTSYQMNEPRNDQRIQSDWVDISYETLPMSRSPCSLAFQHSFLETGQPRTRHGSFPSSVHDDPDVHISDVSTVLQTEPIFYCQPNLYADSSISGHAPLNQPISYISDDERQSPASQSQQSPRNTAKMPLWYMQTKLLLSFFSIMSGDAQLVSETLQSNGFYIIAHRYALDYTSTQQAEMDAMSWLEWVEHEAWRRALGASFILSTLAMVLYDVSPVIGMARDFQMQPIANEDEWSSSSPEEWRKHCSGNAEERKRLGNRTLRDILVDVMMPQPRASGNYSVSLFSAYVLMHAVIVHIWQRFQSSEAVCEPWGSFDGVSNGDSLSAALWNRTLESLARCRLFLHKDRAKQSRTEAQTTELWPPFDHNAILCIAYARLYRPLSASLYLSFTDSVQGDLFACATPYVMGNLERSRSLSEVIAECLDSLKLPSDAGQLLDLSAELLVDAEYDLTESISVAAGVARTWSWYLKGAWFWGITPRMGDILEQLAKTFEQVRKTNRRQSMIEAEFGQ
ncbi:regulatory protein [Fusarium proliferatum]|nr:regulatory protein [Fusarium proliferatum]